MSALELAQQGDRQGSSDDLYQQLEPELWTSRWFSWVDCIHTSTGPQKSNTATQELQQGQ